MKGTFSLTVNNRTDYEMMIIPGGLRVLPGGSKILEHRFSKSLQIRLLREGETVRNSYTAKVTSMLDYAVKYSGGNKVPEWGFTVENEDSDFDPGPDHPVVFTAESNEGRDVQIGGDDERRRPRFPFRK